MISRIYSFILLLILSANILTAQTYENFPALSDADIFGGTITRNEIYDGNSLWGLINGGADLYLEYGFDKLLFNKINIGGKNFRVEIYRMDNPLAAFGIFSVSRYKCSRSDTLTNHICISPYQVQAAVDNFYISIINETGTEEDQIMAMNLFSNILEKTENQSFDLPEFFMNEYFEFFTDQLKYFNGVLGLQNGFPMWIGLIENYSFKEVYLLPYEDENGYAYFAQIKFEDKESAEEFVSQNSVTCDDESFLKIKSLSPEEIIFVDTNLSEEDLKLIIE